MAVPTVNFRDLAMLVADSSSYMSMLIQGMLRSFGANKVIDVKSSSGAMHALGASKIDILICDARLPPLGGLKLTREIRGSVDSENRTIPILMMMSESRETTIKQARDAGANMVIAKPLSPASLYDRLAWIAFQPRQFVDTPTYFGPDRRFKIEGYPNGVGRRKGDKAIEVASEAGPTLAQDDIDNLSGTARLGQE